MVASHLTFPLGTAATLGQGCSRISGQGSDPNILPPKPRLLHAAAAAAGLL